MDKGLKILVVGSANIDMVVKAARIPKSGETILGGVFSMYKGGKGANQALAAAKLFRGTDFCAGVGGDSMGKDYVEYLSSSGVGTELVYTFKSEHTGVALITVDSAGKNIITVAPGANMGLSERHIRKVDFSKYSHVAFQLETPLETVGEGLVLAKKAGCVTVLTPAPARPLGRQILKNVDYLVPNEHEVLLLAGSSKLTVTEAAERLLKRGVSKAVIVTLGSKGCIFCGKDGQKRYPACSVKAVDTVGAGDCFTGAFTAALRMTADADKAVKIASAAAAVKVTRVGAQSLGSLGEVEKVLKSEWGIGLGRK